jgi:UDP-2,3-diacylglucosamine hydrolase
MNIFFFSDLHLHSHDDPLYLDLLSVLETEAQSGDRIVFAGDIFDLFVGDKEVFLNRYQKFFDFLKKAGQKNLLIDYIEGNHDFSMRSVFNPYAAVTWHPQEVIIEFDQKKFYIAHGDLVNEKDYGYLLLRGLYRSLPFKALLKVTPGKWVDRIGQTQSQVSRKLGKEVMDPGNSTSDSKVRSLYRNFSLKKFKQGFDFIVLGHCHDLDEATFEHSQKTGKYFNMGYPPQHGFYLKYTAKESKISRIHFPKFHKNTTA